jgi:hypothetical protein
MQTAEADIHVYKIQLIHNLFQEKKMNSIIAVDPGFGNTKVCLNGAVSMVPSIVVRPRRIGMAGLGMKGASPPVEVGFDNYQFAVGAGAIEWGSPQSSFDYSSLVSPERQALFYAALAPLLTSDVHQIDLLIIGLPVPLLQDEIQSELILSDLKRFKGPHSFKVGKESYALNVEKLKVLPQPLGAYADWLLDETLHPRKNAAQAEVAVLDIGMNTFDLYAVHGGRVEPRFIGGGKVGVRKLLERLDGDGSEWEELDLCIRQGRLQLSAPILQAWLSDLIAILERTMPRLSRFTAVIPTGGGVLILGDLLKLNLASRGGALYWVNDPICSNARGLWKWGTYVFHR